MKTKQAILTLLLISLLLAVPAQSPMPAAQALTTLPSPDPAAAPADFADTPLLFVENVGQWDASARFHVGGALGGGLWLADQGIWLTLVEPSPADVESSELSGAEPETRKAASIRLTFDGANTHPQLVPFDPLDTTVNYYLGDDMRRWRERVPVWRGVRYQDLYPGLDLVLVARGGQWTWQFDVTEPGVDLSAVQLLVEGADAVDVVGGRLSITTALGPAALDLPTLEGVPPGMGPAVEPGAAETFAVSRPFSWSGTMHPSAIPDDDASQLLYSTFLGGGDSNSQGWSLALDGTGQAVVTGYTTSEDFPATPGAYDTSHNGNTDVFVFKLAADGSSLLYSTFVGGGSGDSGRSLALDGAGQAVVTGSTRSSSFPTTPGAYDTSYNGGSIYTPSDSFVFKLAADGGSLLFSTFVGGSSDESAYSLALDGSGQVVITGVTDSSDFPTTPGAYDTNHNGEEDVFVLKLAADGSSLLYSTFVGGTAIEQGNAVALDGAGQAVVTGYTTSADYPTTPGAYDTSHNIYYDVFVTMLAADGSSLVYSTFVGGSDADMGNALALDGDGRAVVTGYTDSAGFPRTYTGDCSVSNAFVFKLSTTGDSLLFSTCVGGVGHSGGGERGHSLALNSAGQVAVTGYTSHENFPTTPGAYDTSFNGDEDVFLFKLAANGSSLLYSTYLGGSDSEYGYSLALSGTRTAAVTGYTGSYNFPATAGAYDASFNGYYDVYVSKLMIPLETPVLSTISNPDGDGDYLVDWSGVTGAVSYTLQEDDDSSFSSPVTLYEGPSTESQVTGREPGRWYYRVRATDADGDSPWSARTDVIVMDAPVISPISNPDGDGDYMVDWNEVTGATSYALYEDDNPGFSSPVSRYFGESTQYQVTGQEAGTWHYRVRGWRAGGSGPWSDTQSVIVSEVPPAAPALSPISNPDGDGDYLVDWNEVTGAISYTLQEDDDASFSSAVIRYEGGNTEFQVAGHGGGIWYYRVEASNAWGDSPWSNIESVVSMHAPVLAPISNPDGDGDYLVDWSDVVGATSYALQQDDNPSFSSPANIYVPSSQKPITGKSAGTWYYRARGVCSGVSGPWSNSEAVVVMDAPVLSPIINPDGDGDYLVDWDEVTGAISYTLQEDDSSSFSSPVIRYEGASTQTQVTGQEYGTWYHRVRGWRTGGYGPWSNSQSVVVIEPLPDTPDLSPIDNPDGDGGYLVDWGEVTGAISYTLQEDDNLSFPSPVTRYLGPDTEYLVAGQKAGTWHYRVRASNTGGVSPWSEAEEVTVELNWVYLPLVLKGQ